MCLIFLHCFFSISMCSKVDISLTGWPAIIIELDVDWDRVQRCKELTHIRNIQSTHITDKKQVNLLHKCKLIKQVAQLWQRPCDACFTLIHKIVKTAFLSEPLGDFRDNISTSSLGRSIALISDNWTVLVAVQQQQHRSQRFLKGWFTLWRKCLVERYVSRHHLCIIR